MISGRLPAVQASLEAGDISYWHARAIAEATQDLDDEKARWVADKVLPGASHQTVSNLYRALRRRVMAVSPKDAAERHEKAKAERTVQWWDLPDGMAELRLTTTAADVLAIFNSIDALAAARPKKDAFGERVGVDARRVDALVNLLTGASGGAVSSAGRSKPLVQVTMDLATLLGLKDNPGELAGYGPIPAPAARALAADGKWRRLIHDPLTGALLDLGRTSYEPSEPLKRFIVSRDARCAFPGCNQPAHRCHLDHTCPYGCSDGEEGAGYGRTDRANLKAMCENHHILKHKAGWSLLRDPDTHEGTWISPTGHRYPAPHHDHRSVEALDESIADELVAMEVLDDGVADDPPYCQHTYDEEPPAYLDGYYECELAA